MTILEEFHRDEQRVLDHLVDGELSAANRRELLSALDDEPGAWRRCALAFLEAQSWRWQLSRLAAEPLVSHVSSTPPPAPSGLRRRSLWGWGLAIAAGLLVAFSLGTRFPVDKTLDDAALARQEAAIGDVAPTLDVPSLDEPWDSRALADNETEVDDGLPWETLTLASEDGSKDDAFQLRVLNADADGGTSAASDQALVAQVQSAISSRLMRELEAAGWEVKRERRLVRVELSDGRRMIVPVDEVDISYPEVAQF
jgi:DNA-binding transcriptional ArsR family regulator